MPGVTSDTKTYDDVMQALKSKNQKAQAPKPGVNIYIRRCVFYSGLLR